MRNQFQWIVILTILYDEFTFSVKVFLAELSYEFENLMSAHFKNTPNLVQFASHISQNFIPHLLVTNPFSKLIIQIVSNTKMMNHCLVTKHDLMPILGTQWEFRNKWNLKQCANQNFERKAFVRLSIAYNSYQ